MITTESCMHICQLQSLQQPVEQRRLLGQSLFAWGIWISNNLVEVYTVDRWFIKVVAQFNSHNWRGLAVPSERALPSYTLHWQVLMLDIHVKQTTSRVSVNRPQHEGPPVGCDTCSARFDKRLFLLLMQVYWGVTKEKQKECTYKGKQAEVCGKKWQHLLTLWGWSL